MKVRRAPQVQPVVPRGVVRVEAQQLLHVAHDEDELLEVAGDGEDEVLLPGAAGAMEQLADLRNFRLKITAPLVIFGRLGPGFHQSSSFTEIC